MIPLHSLSADPSRLSSKDAKESAREVKLGSQIADDVAKQYHFVTDKAEVERVNRIGQRLAVVANTQVIPAGFGNAKVYPFLWHFSIVDEKDVNAFSLPGGYVYVDSGLLKLVRSDDELAGVLSHEITHSAHHHVMEIAREQSKMSMDMAAGIIAAFLAHVPGNDIANGAAFASYAQTGVLNTQFNQKAEQDADHGGVLIMQKAGFNPVGMLTFMLQLGDIERKSPNIELGIFRDHPYTDDRVTAIKAELASLNVPITPASIRAVTGAPRITVVSNGSGRQTLIFGSDTSTPHTIVSLFDPDSTRSNLAALELNVLLDNGLRLGDVTSEGPSIVIGKQFVLTLNVADSGSGPGESPEQAAVSAAGALQQALWADSIASNAPVY